MTFSLSGTVEVKRNAFGQFASSMAISTDGWLDQLCSDIVTRSQAALYPGHGLDTGALHDSFEVLPGPHPLSRIIHVAAPYAAYVEFGTSRMAAIPFLTPAVSVVMPSAAAAWRARLLQQAP